MRLRRAECGVNFGHVRDARLRHGRADRCRIEGGGVDEKSRIGHILWVQTTHHFCEQEIESVGAENAQVPQRGQGDGNEVLQPCGPQDHLALLEEVGEVEAGGFERTVRGFERIPERGVRVEMGLLGGGEDGVHIEGKVASAGGGWKPRARAARP